MSGVFSFCKRSCDAKSSFLRASKDCNSSRTEPGDLPPLSGPLVTLDFGHFCRPVVTDYFEQAAESQERGEGAEVGGS